MADFDIDDRTLPPRTDALDDLLPLLPRHTHQPLVGYAIDAAAVRKRDAAGDTVQCAEKAQWYVV